MALPAFACVRVLPAPLAGAIACEDEWAQQVAASGQPSAWLWQAPLGLVVPRRYTSLPGWPAARRQVDGELQVRRSGGGVVPQGPGLWNLSLLWPAPTAEPQAADVADAADAVYRELCARLRQALARLGVQAHTGAVDGSFCDGRYNLAVAGRKLVGTAQAWRRLQGQPVVLAHAVIVVDAEVQALCARANALEAALGSAQRYRPQALTSVAAEAGGGDVVARTLAALAASFAPGAGGVRAGLTPHVSATAPRCRVRCHEPPRRDAWTCANASTSTP